MRALNCLVLLSCVLGCAASSSPCAQGGEPYQAAESNFCLYARDAPLVIEGGFECPVEFSFRFDTDEGIACSQRDLARLPLDVCAQLGAECDPGSEQGPRPHASEPASPPNTQTEPDPWRKVAEDRGFLGSLQGADFFAAMQFACVVDTGTRPATLQELVDESDRVVLASIEEIAVVPELPSAPTEVVDEEVYLRLDVKEAAKGTLEPSILVQDTCGSGGLVFPLRERRPTDSFVFFLDAPTFTSAGTPQVRNLMYFYLGIVRDDPNGPTFALGDDGPAPSLSDFDSLRAILDAVSAQGS